MEKKYILETERIRLRQYQQSDLENSFALNSDPEVMKYINNGIPLTKAEVQRNIDLITSQYSKYKHFGLWAAEEKTSGNYMGWFSLKPLRGTPETEIGYRLMKKYWGRGLATEGAKAMVDRAFQVAQLVEVGAITHLENEASKRVLQKAGFHWVRKGPFTSEGRTRDVDWFLQSSPHVNSLLIKKAAPGELDMIREFYKGQNYDHALSPDDDIHCVFGNNEIWGAARLVRENGTVVLRGMQVTNKHQQRGIDRKLLISLNQSIGDRECYCIPFHHLENFYGTIGFKKINESEAPAFLQERFKKYLMKNSVIIMKREGLS